MDRHQENNNSSERATPRANKEERVGNTASRKSTEITENLNIVKELKGTTTKSMSSTIKVEVQRTFLTARGRKFPPREPKRFELSSTDNMSASIQEKIAESFPRMSGQFTLLVKDTDGEFIPCKDDTDLLKALNTDQLKLFVQGQGQGRNKVVNEPVHCTSCHGDVNGIRTKCLQCPDYNLCTECAGNGIHGDHVMVRSDKPWFFKVGLVKFAEAIPSLCEKHIAEHSSSDCLPRLSPPDVRQFWQSQHKPQGQGQEVAGAGRQGHQQGRGVALRKMWRVFLTNIAHEVKTRSPATKEEMKQEKKANKECDKKNVKQTECSACNTKIAGSRTKCLQCEDYSLCDQCENKGVHADHVMVTCDRPRFFNFALPMFREVIPLLCEKHVVEHNNSEVIPRLTAKDVRQFWKSQRKQRGRNQPKKTDGDGTEQEGQNPTQMKGMGHRCRGNRQGNLHHGAAHQVPVNDQESVQGTELDSKTETQQSPDGEQMRTCRQQKLQQMKRQWIQKCTQQWRQQLQSMCEVQSDGAEANERQKPVTFWRSYMRQSWDQWQSDMAENGMTVDDLPGPRNANQQFDVGLTPGTPNPRRQWIQTCWKLWRDEANKFGQSSSAQENEEVAGGPCKRPEESVKCHGLPFPGYGMMMNKSWRLMLDQMKSQMRQQRSGETPGKEQTLDDDIVEPDVCPTIGPHAATQILKKCWVNGCRQLWWMHVRKEMDGTSEVDMSPQGAAVNDKQPFLTTEVMKEMSKESKWKNYMQECWKLWKQLSKKSGLSQKQPTEAGRTEADMETEEVQSVPVAEAARPKQQWFKDTWTMWKEDMSKQATTTPTDTKDGCKTRKQWKNVRPFPGWHPLIVKSWKLMQDQLQTENIEEQKHKDLSEAMKSAWMREVDRKMKELSVSEEAAGSRAGPQSQNPPVYSRAGSQKAAGSLSNHDYPSDRAQLVGNLMEQYWTMVASWQRGQQAGEKPGKCWRQEWRQWNKPRVEKHYSAQGEGESEGPRLRVTLSMRSTPANDP